MHPLSEVQIQRRGRGLLDRDDAVLADLLEGLGEQLADLAILAGDGRDGRDLLLALDLDGDLAELGREGLDSRLDASSEEHTSELQSRGQLVCRLLLEKKKFMWHI